MNNIQRYFFDQNGNKIQFEDNLSHDDISKRIIDMNPEYKMEYQKIAQKGMINKSVYLVMKGYIYVGEKTKNYSGAMYSSISLNENTRLLMSELKANDFYIYDVITNELSNEQKNTIREWAKNGMSKDEIRSRVISDMIIPLCPKRLNKNHEEELDER